MMFRNAVLAQLHDGTEHAEKTDIHHQFHLFDFWYEEAPWMSSEKETKRSDAMTQLSDNLT